jgi:hypothetical protein
MQVINRSPAYKNQYVHRRDSLSVQSLSTAEIAKRVRLGLITAGAGGDDNDDESEEWHDFESESEEQDDAPMEQYTFAQNRRSSIDLSQMTQHFHDSSASANFGMDAGGSSRDLVGGSSRDLGGLIREILKEDELDDEASTVNGDDIDDKDMLEK